MAKVMYAFSGDPITYGHIDIIKRVSNAFGDVIVGIGAHPGKTYTFTLEERTKMANKALQIPNVRVLPFDGMLAHFAYENNISFVIKGVRGPADFDYEKNQSEVVAREKLGVDTFTLFARPELAVISSSTVKAIQKAQGMIHNYVPLYVKQCLEERISGQYVLGITGEIGSGKSYVSRKFCEFGKEKGIQVHDIDLDGIGHQILGSLKEPRYEMIREEISARFGVRRLEDGSIDRKALGNIVFEDKSKMQKLNEIMHDPLIIRLKREMYGKKGIILVNAALIAESGMGYLCNNNVALVSCNKESQERRLSERKLDQKQIKRRLESQYDFEKKRNELEKAIERDDQGEIWFVENSDGTPESSIKDAFEHFIKYFKLGNGKS